ncbi:MAG TPA: hypothetical protein VH638_05170, partial [Gemmatimonadaceae bacterium]
FCMTMISDGAKAKEAGTPVVDIAEVVAARLSAGVEGSRGRGVQGADSAPFIPRPRDPSTPRAS